MKTGTKSLLMGAHQLIIHPILVCRAWHKLYGHLDFKTFLCIMVHDWGYWGCKDMDGQDGMFHPYRGACAIQKLGDEYIELCLYHSRDFAGMFNHEPSKLCWADKYSFCFEVPWFYILRTKLTGELYEYRAKAAINNLVPRDATDMEWFQQLSAYLEQLSWEKATQ